MRDAEPGALVRLRLLLQKESELTRSAVSQVVLTADGRVVKVCPPREALACASIAALGLPGVVPMEAATVVSSEANLGDVHAVVMPFLHTFRDSVVGNALRHEDVLFSVAGQLRETLSGLHEGGWLHRDIKPDNLLFDVGVGSFRVNLCDFGSAVKRADHESECARNYRTTWEFAASALLRRRGGVFKVAFDWEAFFYTVAWLAGARWTRPSLDDSDGDMSKHIKGRDQAAASFSKYRYDPTTRFSSVFGFLSALFLAG